MSQELAQHDRTPLGMRPSFRLSHAASSTAVSEPSTFAPVMTAFASVTPTSLPEPQVAGTSTLLELETRRTPPPSARPAAEERTDSRNDVEAIAANRTILLIQRFEGRASREDEARLEMLTQRLRRLSPRVTREDMDILTAAVDEIEDIDRALATLDAEYGL